MSKLRRKVRKNEISKAHAWAAEGLSTSEICRRLNRNYTTVQRMLERPVVMKKPLEDSEFRADELPVGAGSPNIITEVINSNLTAESKLTVLGSLFTEFRG